MTDAAKTKRYALRLTERCAFYDERTHMFRDMPAGSVISDPALIKLLEARGAPIEIIEPLEEGYQE
jgi:hypothetical protein